MERRHIDKPLRVETREDGAARVEGYASRYYDGNPGTEYRLWPGAVERIMPGAFEGIANNVMALFNHDPSRILGSTRAGSLKLEARSDGLFYSVEVPDTPTGKEVSANVRAGNIQGSSFGFRITDEEWRTEDDVDIREVRGVELLDVSPVTYPAYADTSAGIRSTDGADEARTSYDSWKARERQAQDMKLTELRRLHARAVAATVE